MALRTVQCEVSCKQCHSGIKWYTSVERDSKLEKAGWTWYTELPLEFVCTCGTSRLDLSTIRQHYHASLEPVVGLGREMLHEQIYQKGALADICKRFSQLLDKDPPEEELQQFIKDNPVLLHHFAPAKIYNKPPILSLYHADFAIWSHDRDLILIELERAGTKLLKQHGGMSAELQQPLDQLGDWLHTCADHRLSVLHGIDRTLMPQNVAKIRGVAIVGRDAGYDSEQLQRLKWTDFPNGIEFLTYDDLLRSLAGLVRTFEAL